MTDIRRQLDQVVSSTLAQHIIPVKTAEGILVGSVLIASEGAVKHLSRNGEYLYKNVSLNAVAVKLANLLARHRSSVLADRIYQADQEYAKWFTDSQLLLKKHHSAVNNKEYDRADTLWAKYIESKDRTVAAKNAVMGLTLF
jgi:hypothetical protein